MEPMSVGQAQLGMDGDIGSINFTRPDRDPGNAKVGFVTNLVIRLRPVSGSN